MLVGGDLGFWFRVSVVAFVPLIATLLVFLARLKRWREAVARNEEVEQLFVVASEEVARARYFHGYGGGYHQLYDYDYGSHAEVEDQSPFPELLGVSAAAALSTEAPGPVSNPLNMLYPCAVCSRLTKARCKECKAVHYCSGKCQIIHWRLGHKNECSPYTSADQKSDLGGTSYNEFYSEEENGIYGYVVNNKGNHSSNYVETSFVEPAFSSYYSPLAYDGESGTIDVDDFLADKWRCRASGFTSNTINSSSEHIGMNGSHAFSHGFEEKQTVYANIQQTKPSVSELPMSVRSVDSNATPINSFRMNLSNGYADKSCISSNSSLGAFGSVKSSLSEPSTSSSGLWEGKLVQNRSRFDAPDDVSHTCSSDANENNGSGSQCSSTESPKSVLPHVDSSNGKTAELDGSKLISSNIRKSAGGDTISVDEGEGDVTRKSPSLTPETTNYVGGSGSSTKTIYKPGQLCPAAGTGEKLMPKEILKASGLPSLSTGTSNCGVESVGSSHKLESRNIESKLFKASEAPLSSNSGGIVVGGVKVVKNGSAQGQATYSLELGGLQLNDRNESRTSGQRVVHQPKASMQRSQHTLDGNSAIAERYKGIFPYEMFLKLYNWKSFGFCPSGLVNCGNSCYANAVLQCLAFTPPLTAYLLQGLHSKSSCSKYRQGEKKEWCFTCEFERLLLMARAGASPLSPIQIISHLQDIGRHLSNGSQEDAHEFLRYAIDAMQSICLKQAGISESGSPEEATTLIGLTFGGYLRSKIECMGCGGMSVRHDKMMDITVEIDGHITTLEEALRQFTRPETLDGDNRYECSRCNSYVKARKKLKVQEAPNILSIVLKRFQVYESGTLGKLYKAIKFPEILNLAPYMCGTSDKSPIYCLYGVVVHLDIMDAAVSGHYVCYVKNMENKWFEVDDSKVKEVELERVLTKPAYMLLYARCSPRAPRLIGSSLFPPDPIKSPHHKPRSFFKSWRGGCPESKNHPSHAGPKLCGTISGEDRSSDPSSFFSDAGTSSSTDTTSDGDSTSFDEPLDRMVVAGWHSQWTHSSDFETTSSSSSSPPPTFCQSPLFPKQSPFANSHPYASRCPNNGGWCMQNNSVHVPDVHRLRSRSVSRSNLQVSDTNNDNIQTSYPKPTMNQPV